MFPNLPPITTMLRLPIYSTSATYNSYITSMTGNSLQCRKSITPLAMTFTVTVMELIFPEYFWTAVDTYIHVS